MGKIETRAAFSYPCRWYWWGRRRWSAESWPPVGVADFDPALVAVSLTRVVTRRKVSCTTVASACFPSRDLVQKTDYCGLVSGKDTKQIVSSRLRTGSCLSASAANARCVSNAG